MYNISEDMADAFGSRCRGGLSARRMMGSRESAWIGADILVAVVGDRT